MRIYIADAFFLYQTGQLLQSPEKFGFLTGFDLSAGITVLTQLLPVRFTATRTGAEPDAGDTLRAIKLAKRLGLKVRGSGHSHPGEGPECTMPSSQDINTARIWEADDDFIGLVFSEGGRYVRVYNHEQESILQVCGNFIQRGPKLFEIPQVGDRDLPPSAGGTPVLELDAQAGAVRVVEPENDICKRGPRRWRWRPRGQHHAHAGANGHRKS